MKKNKSIDINETISQKVSVKLEFKNKNRLSSDELINTINTLFENIYNKYSIENKTFIFGGYMQKYITLEEVVAHFADNPSVTVINSADCQKYRCGIKVD